ncbi:MAG: hypothetical protein RLZZ165_242 [Bacteroidota bacterium]
MTSVRGPSTSRQGIVSVARAMRRPPLAWHSKSPQSSSTCIQTIENDVWYKFKAEKDAESYEIQIVSESCNSPAGLQALLIQAEDCNAATFIYRGCSNKISTDTIQLFLEAPDAGQNYFIWIDGYDGTICEFSITLKTRSKLSTADLRFLRFDYSLNDLPQLPLEDLEASFSNNVATLTWSADPTDPTELYIVELLPDVDGLPEHSYYGRVVGYVDPHHFVGAGSSQYTFTDDVTPYEQGRAYRYKVISLGADLQRTASQELTVESRLVESFYVHPVSRSPENGKFVAHYVNSRKGQNFDVSVENEKGERVKHLRLLREPVRDGDITIDMSALPHGSYCFIMSNGHDAFKRSFVWQP